MIAWQYLFRLHFHKANLNSRIAMQNQSDVWQRSICICLHLLRHRLLCKLYVEWHQCAPIDSAKIIKVLEQVLDPSRTSDLFKLHSKPESEHFANMKLWRPRCRATQPR